MRTIVTPADLVQAQRACIAKIEQGIATINAKLGINLSVPQIRFNLSGTTAGKAWATRNLIELNSHLLRDNSDAFIERTPLHEVAHLAAFVKFGAKIKPHGHEWGKCCWCLNIPAVRCHSYDTSGIPGRAMLAHTKANNERQTSEGKVKTVAVGRIIELED